MNRRGFFTVGLGLALFPGRALGDARETDGRTFKVYCKRADGLLERVRMTALHVGDEFAVRPGDGMWWRATSEPVMKGGVAGILAEFVGARWPAAARSAGARLGSLCDPNRGEGGVFTGPTA